MSLPLVCLLAQKFVQLEPEKMADFPLLHAQKSFLIKTAPLGRVISSGSGSGGGGVTAEGEMSGRKRGPCSWQAEASINASIINIRFAVFKFKLLMNPIGIYCRFINPILTRAAIKAGKGRAQLVNTGT
jgi:hypothetical protein